jgi:hypothetical protein
MGFKINAVVVVSVEQPARLPRRCADYPTASADASAANALSGGHRLARLLSASCDGAKARDARLVRVHKRMFLSTIEGGRHVCSDVAR